jgi:hypothetical protein
MSVAELSRRHDYPYKDQTQRVAGCMCEVPLINKATVSKPEVGTKMLTAFVSLNGKLLWDITSRNGSLEEF